MSTIIKGFSFDNFGFYENGMPFYPLIAPDFEEFNATYNTCKIYVDLSKSSTLCFDQQKSLAQAITEKKGKILWDIDFKLVEEVVDVRFEGFFNTLNLGFTSFLNDLLAPYLKDSFGVCLFKSSLGFLDLLPWNKADEIFFEEWLKDEIGLLKKTSCEKHLKRLFLMNTFSEYLHRFSSRIFDETISFVSFNTQDISSQAKIFQLLSHKRFNHIKLIVSDHHIPLDGITQGRGYPGFGSMGKTIFKKQDIKKPKVGVCFPDDPYCDEETLKKFDKLFRILSEHNISYRIFPEHDGMHGWDELDSIIILSQAVSAYGKRILQGFKAAMGEVVYIDKPLHLFEERSLEEWIKNRGRGI